MKTKAILLLAGGTALLLAADAPKKPSSDIETLQARIAALEERVNILEARASFAPGGPSLTPPAPSPELRYLTEPPNIGSIDINGLKIFKVPLNARAFPDNPNRESSLESE